MIVDGKQLASDVTLEIKESVKKLSRSPHLLIVLVGDNPMSVKYTSFKKQLGESVDIQVTLQSLADDSTTAGVVAVVKAAAADPAIDGIIVQLPLPKQIDRDLVIGAIPADKDVDALTDHPHVLSPVVMAVKIILEKHQALDFNNKKVLVIGRGRLVGVPVAAWLESIGATVTMVGSSTPPAELLALTSAADVIVTGAGVPGLIQPEMIKEGVILIDPSTSDVSGKTVGDIDPSCATKAALYTPVPGGIGPLTVVMLFANLVELTKK